LGGILPVSCSGGGERKLGLGKNKSEEEGGRFIFEKEGKKKKWMLWSTFKRNAERKVPY